MRFESLTALIIAVLACLSGCKETIVHNLVEMDANKLIARLHEERITAQKEKQADGKWAVSVQAEDALKAIQHLDKSKFSKNAAMQPSEKASVMSSREEQRFVFERSLSREIETTLAGVEGVLYARVHLNLPQVDPVFGQKLHNEKGSASVLLLADGGFTQQKEEVAALVGGASGVEESSIKVLVTRSAVGALSNEAAQGTAPEPREGGILMFFGDELSGNLLSQHSPYMLMFGIVLAVSGSLLLMIIVRRSRKVRC